MQDEAQLQSATEEYFNLDRENAIFEAKISLSLRLRSDNLNGKFFKLANLLSSFNILRSHFGKIKVICRNFNDWNLLRLWELNIKFVNNIIARQKRQNRKTTTSSRVHG